MIRLLFILLLSLSGCFGHKSVEPSLVSSAEFEQPIDFERIDHDRLDEAIVRMTNAVRKREGKSQLNRHGVLARASRKYAKRMVDREFLSHIDPYADRLRTPQDRVEAAGGKNASTAENIADVPGFQIASGQPFYMLDPDEPVIALQPGGPPVDRHTYATLAAMVVEGWMNSPGHRKNLLSDEAVEVGVGAAMYRQNGVPSFVIVQKFQQFEPLE